MNQNYLADARVAVRLDAVTKVYGSGTTTVTALDEVSLEVTTGSFTALMGPSGSERARSCTAPRGWNIRRPARSRSRARRWRT
jgi:ABC-type dipeptide/oligopeptide/nickel transport system ATPase subunit